MNHVCSIMLLSYKQLHLTYEYSVFHVSNSEHMPATNQESPGIPPLAIFSDRMSLLTIHCIQPLSTLSIKGQMWDPAQSDQRFQIQRTFETTCLPRMSPMFGHFFHPDFKRSIPSQKWICIQQTPLNIPKQRKKITCQCTKTPSVTSKTT